MQGSTIINWCFWFLVAIAGFFLIQLSLPYLAFLPNVDFLRTKQLIYHKELWRWSFYIHVFSSPIAFVAGLLQFLPLVQHKLALHKYIGLSYLISFLILAGPSGFILGWYANGEPWSQLSFCLLSLIWLFFGVMAYITVRKKDYHNHMKWVMRSLFLMFSAVMLRFYAFCITYFNIDLHPRTAYTFIAWASWIPNLFIGEWIIRSKFVRCYLQEQYWPK